MRLSEILFERNRQHIELMYHGTSTKLVPSILKNGLLANPPKKTYSADTYGSSTASMGGVYVASDRGWAETISSEAVGTHGGEPALVTIQYVKGSADLDEDEIVSTISDAVQKVLIDLSHQVPDDYEADMSYPGRGWAADQMIANPQDAADMIATKTVELLSNFSAPRNAAKDIIKQMALRLLMQTKDINDPGERVRAMSFNAYDTFRDEMEELLAKLMIQVSPDTPNNSADTRRINRDIKFKGKTRIIQIESPIGKIVYKDPT